MKKSLTILVIFLMFIMIVSCQSLYSNDDTDFDMNVQIIDERFSISIPNDYETTSSEYIDKYFIKDNSASIIVTKDTESTQYTSASDYYSNAFLQYVNTLDNVEEISMIVTTLDSYNTCIAEFRYQIFSSNSNDIIDITCYAEYILLGNTIYIVTCSAPTDTYYTYRDEFIESAKSVMIT